MVEVFASLAAYIALVSLLIWAPRLRRRWQRITSRVIGGLGAAPLVVALPAVLFGVALASGNPPTKSRVVKSPTGEEATLNYSAGFLGRDYTEITLKKAGCCRHVPIFSHNGPSSFDDPQVEWMDNKHLHITFHTRPDDPQHCEQHVESTFITCTALLFPQVQSETKPAQ
jgi:hypothetical protein